MSTKTISQLAQDALDVQNACNLSGVVHGFSRAMSDLCQLVSGTDARNNHPICILWADKIAHLTGTQELGSSVVMRAYDVCYDLAKQGK
jgi:hypothetical protein